MLDIFRRLRPAPALLLLALSGPLAAEQSVIELGPRTLTVRPGTNLVTEIAIGHLNRIVTPFSNPVVRTVADVTTELEGNVVYLAANSTDPATLYITDDAYPNVAIGLTLAPRAVPPQELRLRVPGLSGSGATAPARAAAPTPMPTLTTPAWRPGADPYISGLTAGLRALALGEAPLGGSAKRSGRRLIQCPQPGLKLDTEARFDTPGLRWQRLQATNRGADTVTIDPAACTMDAEGRLAAIAVWPRQRLRSGESTNLLIAVQIAP